MLSNCSFVAQEAEKLLADNKLEDAERAYVKILQQANNNRLHSPAVDTYQQLITCLQQLGFITILKIKFLPHKLDETDRYCRQIGDRCLRAIILYNAALIINQKFNNADPQKFHELTDAIKETEKLFLKLLCNKIPAISGWQEEIQYCKRWERIRDQAAARLEEIDKIELKSVDDHLVFYTRAQIVRKLDTEVVNGIKALVGQMIQKRITELELLEHKLPCDFAFISFGSLAKESATPYSDLEFGILLAEGKDNDLNKRYFRILSYLLAFNVINLRQTAVPIDFFREIDRSALIDLDQIIKPGFQFDLGGKTPLGRQDKPYDLIQTPIKLAKFLNPEYFEIDKYLPIETASCGFLYGNERMARDYQEIIEEFFKNNQNRLITPESRALEIIYLGNKYLEADLNKYKVFVGADSYDAKNFFLKKELYRLLDRLLEGISFYHQIYERSNWQKLEQLYKGQYITYHAMKNLQILSAILNETRNRVYLYQQGQVDELSINTYQMIFNHDLYLSRFYFSMIPFYDAVYEFFSQVRENTKITSLNKKDVQADSKFLLNDFYNCTHKYQGLVYKRLGHLDKAQASLEQAIRDDFNDFDAHMALGFVYASNGYFHQALMPYQESCRILIRELAENFGSINYASIVKLLMLAQACGIFADACIDVEDDEAAEKFVNQSLEIFEMLAEIKYPAEAFVLNAAARLYCKQKRYQEAKNFLEKSLAIENEAYGQQSIEVANTTFNLSIVYAALGEKEQELDCLKRSLSVYQKQYDTSHRLMKSTLERLNSINDRFKQLKENEFYACLQNGLNCIENDLYEASAFNLLAGLKILLEELNAQSDLLGVVLFKINELSKILSNEESKQKLQCRLIRIRLLKNVGDLLYDNGIIEFAIQYLELVSLSLPNNSAKANIMGKLGCLYTMLALTNKDNASLVGDNFANANENFEASLSVSNNFLIKCCYALSLFQQQNYLLAILQLLDLQQMPESKDMISFEQSDQLLLDQFFEKEFTLSKTIEINANSFILYYLFKCYLALDDKEVYIDYLSQLQACQKNNIQEDGLVSKMYKAAMYELEGRGNNRLATVSCGRIAMFSHQKAKLAKLAKLAELADEGAELIKWRYLK